MSLTHYACRYVIAYVWSVLIATLRCNCDARDGDSHFDGGYITDTENLPIKAFKAGDTGKIPRTKLVLSTNITKFPVQVGMLMCCNLRFSFS